MGCPTVARAARGLLAHGAASSRVESLLSIATTIARTADCPTDAHQLEDAVMLACNNTQKWEDWDQLMEG